MTDLFLILPDVHETGGKRVVIPRYEFRFRWEVPFPWTGRALIAPGQDNTPRLYFQPLRRRTSIRAEWRIAATEPHRKCGLFHGPSM
jgi:hypothetical protein